MKSRLSINLLFMLVLSLLIIPAAFAQENRDPSSSDNTGAFAQTTDNFARDNIEVTYIGSDPVPETSNRRYNYLVKEIQVNNRPNGKGNGVADFADEDLTRLIIELCDGEDMLEGFSPVGTEAGIDYVAIVSESSVGTGLAWFTDEDFDADGPTAGDERIFSIIVAGTYYEGLIAVQVQTGSGDTYIRYVPGPVCADCTDASLIPFWDATTNPVTSDGDGMATVVLNAPHGLKIIKLAAPSSNIALVEVRVPGTDDVLDFAGSDALTGGENSGFKQLDFFGFPWDIPAEVELVFAALDQGSSSFYLEFTDCCLQTARVDPVLQLFDTATGTEADGTLPAAFNLQQNYPNPFNPETVLRFDLPASAQVRLAVYDLLGREVKVLLSGSLPAGAHAVRWDGRDASGRTAASGVYLYRLVAGSFTQTRHMTLLR